MRARIRIGIDAGKKGAMAIVITLTGDKADESRRIVCVIPFNPEAYILELWAVRQAFAPEDIRNADIKCALERVHAMPKQGVTSTFSFGENYGWIQGVLETLEIPYETVEPQRWKRCFGVTADKNTSITVARRLFPNTSLKRTDKCKKDDDGIAESLLIAEYASRTM